MKIKTKLIRIIFGVVLLLFLFSKFIIKQPIIIGFTAQLTGSQAELGVQERNGAELAFENINNSGGINGHKIKLLVKDDLGTPTSAKNAEKELIENGAVAIIGHATSGQTIAGMEISSNAGIMLISPTASSPKLSGIDDNLFLLCPSFKNSSRAFSKYISKESGIKKIGIIYDLDNKAFTETYMETFSSYFKSFGGEISTSLSYASLSKPNFSEIVNKLATSGAEGVLLIASDSDTALIAQRIRISGLRIHMFSSLWAQTQTLINNGGKSVEGMILEQSFTPDNKEPAFMKFQEQYMKRFGIMPSFGALFAYEAAMVLSDAIKKSGNDSSKIKKHLKNVKNFQGLIDKFSIDEYGDVKRPFYLNIIENKHFRVIKKLEFDKGSDK